MPRGRILTLATAALLLEALPLVVAHGTDHNDGMDMGGMPEAPATNPEAHTRPMSYWSYSEHASLVYVHILLMVMGWTIVLPVGMC